VFSVAVLLGVFYALDRYYHGRGWHDEVDPIEEIERLGVDGKVNLPLLAAVPFIVFAMGAGRGFLPTLEWQHLHIEASTIVGCAALIAVAVASLRLTGRGVRPANSFSWHPMAEVAAVFAAIFITIVPALAMLRAGQQGAMAPLLGLVAPEGKPIDAIYFWITGILSSVLDNAPTYLVFFNLAGGDAATLTGPLARTLAAISLGAVLMGANTYIGNAPNFMVKAICEESRIAMPSFFGFMAWAAIFLFPLYLMLTLIFFR
jgi:Na+/H+ antiporter NhaD/arsenite permease-like protein